MSKWHFPCKCKGSATLPCGSSGAIWTSLLVKKRALQFMTLLLPVVLLESV